MKMPWSLYAVMTESSKLRAFSMPTHTASCPSYKWQKPRICCDLNSCKQAKNPKNTTTARSRRIRMRKCDRNETRNNQKQMLQQQPSDKNSGNTWVHAIQMQRRRRRRSSGSLASWARTRRSRVRLFVPCQLWSPFFEWRSSRDRCSSDLRC